MTRLTSMRSQKNTKKTETLISKVSSSSGWNSSVLSDSPTSNNKSRNNFPLASVEGPDRAHLSERQDRSDRLERSERERSDKIEKSEKTLDRINHPERDRERDKIERERIEKEKEKVEREKLQQQLQQHVQQQQTERERADKLSDHRSFDRSEKARFSSISPSPNTSPPPFSSKDRERERDREREEREKEPSNKDKKRDSRLIRTKIDEPSRELKRRRDEEVREKKEKEKEKGEKGREILLPSSLPTTTPPTAISTAFSSSEPKQLRERTVSNNPTPEKKDEKKLVKEKEKEKEEKEKEKDREIEKDREKEEVERDSKRRRMIRLNKTNPQQAQLLTSISTPPSTLSPTSNSVTSPPSPPKMSNTPPLPYGLSPHSRKDAVSRDIKNRVRTTERELSSREKDKKRRPDKRR